jgi:hypothetical protein
MEPLNICFSCLKRKAELTSSTFVCAECATSDKTDGRHLIRALRTLGVTYRVHEAQTAKVEA